MHVATFSAHILAVNLKGHKHISVRTCLEYKKGDNPCRAVLRIAQFYFQENRTQ